MPPSLFTPPCLLVLLSTFQPFYIRPVLPNVPAQYPDPMNWIEPPGNFTATYKANLLTEGQSSTAGFQGGSITYGDPVVRYKRKEYFSCP